MGKLPTWQAQEYTCSYDELGFSCCLSLKHWRLFPALGDYFQGKSAFSVASGNRYDLTFCELLDSLVRGPNPAVLGIDLQVNIYHISTVLKYFHSADISSWDDSKWTHTQCGPLKTVLRITVGEGVNKVQRIAGKRMGRIFWDTLVCCAA